MARWMFHTHLWVGVIVSFLAISLSVTGIMLNHKRVLGFMPETEVERPDAFDVSLPLPELAAGESLKVVVEVTLALDDGEVLVVGLRNDVFLEKLHSGEIFGDAWILLSDFGAVALIILLLTGFWIWLYPRARAR